MPCFQRVPWFHTADSRGSDGLCQYLTCLTQATKSFWLLSWVIKEEIFLANISKQQRNTNTESSLTRNECKAILQRRDQDSPQKCPPLVCGSQWSVGWDSLHNHRLKPKHQRHKIQRGSHGTPKAPAHSNSTAWPNEVQFTPKRGCTFLFQKAQINHQRVPCAHQQRKHRPAPCWCRSSLTNEKHLGAWCPGMGSHHPWALS